MLNLNLKLPEFNFVQNCFPVTVPSNYFCMAKITEAILKKIKVCGTFIIKFCIEIHLLKDDSRYHENK